jgi:hypothetical protein
MSLHISFAAQDPPDQMDASVTLVATSREGLGAVHLVGEGLTPLCGADPDGMAVGAAWGELDREHSDLCKRCIKIQTDE